MVTNNKQRNNTIDAISAIFIIEIVLQHILQNSNLYENSLYQKIVLVLPVFMPWFYFKAGLMFKKPKGLKGCIMYRSEKLLRPFVIWSIIPAMIVLPFYLINGNILQFLKACVSSLFYAHGVFNTPLWFLASLFQVYVIAEIVEYYRIRWGGDNLFRYYINFILLCRIETPFRS